uniref:Uncharacterized protein n=1 Tax=Tanacetum cinerariifolium TaxID=118510 RepID=A0A6L2NV67_TANCI|nr:hypothetical protein [Tanacetum cinerariifolium]
MSHVGYFNKGLPSTTCDSLGSMIEVIFSTIMKSMTHPSVMMRFLRNIEGIGLLISVFIYFIFLLVRIIILLNYLNKHQSLSSFFVQTNYVSDDWGTKPSDLKNELSWRTFLVTNETDGSDGEEGLVLMFFELSVSFHSSSFGLLFSDLSGYLGHIVTALIELWIRVEH